MRVRPTSPADLTSTHFQDLRICVLIASCLSERSHGRCAKHLCADLVEPISVCIQCDCTRHTWGLVASRRLRPAPATQAPRLAQPAQQTLLRRMKIEEHVDCSRQTYHLHRWRSEEKPEFVQNHVRRKAHARTLLILLELFST